MEGVLFASILLNCVVTFSGVSSIVWLRFVNGLKWTSIFMFTLWTIVAQIIASCFFIVSDACRLWSCYKKTEKKAIKNGPKEAKKTLEISSTGIYRYLLFHVSFVMVTLTALMFWVIYTINPHALVPKDFYYPTLLNHMHHTFPLIFAIVQMFFFARKEINTFNVKMNVMTAIEVGMPCVFFVESFYACFIIVTSVFRGKWPYPFLNLLTRLQLGVLIVGAVVFGLVVSHMLHQITFKVARSIKRKNTNVKKTK